MSKRPDKMKLFTGLIYAICLFGFIAMVMVTCKEAKACDPDQIRDEIRDYIEDREGDISAESYEELEGDL